jgi:hypothetical protein
MSFLAKVSIIHYHDEQLPGKPFTLLCKQKKAPTLTCKDLEIKIITDYI